MNSYVLGFQEIDKTRLMAVGGKGANLGELTRIEGIRVPEGFCVTTEAYKRILGQRQQVNELMDQLSILSVEDKEKISEISGKLRRVIEGIPIPKDIEEEIIRYLLRLGEKSSFAVRSSATAEDLPTASFAGQQDTYLNIIGLDAVLGHIGKCWASLFTDRAVIYRMQNGFDHRKVYLSVVVQKMVFPQAAGILFTADPVTSNRKVVSIDASFGLGEALVSGLVNADNYKVREGRIIDKKISTKNLGIFPLEKGGTEKREIGALGQEAPGQEAPGQEAPGQVAPGQNTQTLTDAQILELETVGRKIEACFGCPQDIEWCLAENQFYILQSRPITTLYPVPEVQDGKNHIYMSVGHQQMMTDAIKPLGISFFRLLSDDFLMEEAGGRLYMDLAPDLASPLGQKIALRALREVDPLIFNAIKRLMKRKSFIKSLARGKRVFSMGSGYFTWAFLIQFIKIYRSNDGTIVPMLMSRNEVSMRNLQQEIAKFSGDQLFAFIIEAHRQLKEAMYDSEGMAAIYVGVYAVNWINKKMEKWLGEKGAADYLSQSVANNITSEMGLALLDVADVVRQYPAVVEYLQHADDETFFTGLARLEGGDVVSHSIQGFLEKYGMRCPGEIDITRPRFSEQPTALVPIILSNIKNFEPNARNTIFEGGLLEAKEKELDLLNRLEQLPGGKQKAKKTKKMISRLRNFTGYREYPKYLMIGRYWIFKQALLREAVELVEKGVIREKEDIYYLSFEELREVVRTNRLDYGIITQRKEEYKVYEKLTPPRLMTSEGEVMSGEYDIADIPKGALPGIPVSSGTIEGRARVILGMEDAHLEEGDILVTAFTDPSWTPVFVSIKGLVTEVGGMMTHGAVIAREYGLPAVVGVENATRLIKDGQRIRINGTEGYVEIL